MIRIAIVIVILSFLYMIYVLNNDQYSMEFLLSEAERDFESKSEVHPMFQLLQAKYDPSTRFREQYGQVDQNSLFPIPQAKLQELSVKKFYRYFLTQNAPLHIVDGC